MPVITVQMRTGRTKNAKKKLLRQVTDAAADALEIDAGRIRVLIHEVDDAHFSVGGVSYEDQDKGNNHGS